MVYRSTTVGSIGHSPSEVMLNRRIRTTLPTLSKNNEPRMYDGDKVKQKHEASQKSNEFYYNRRYSSRSLPVLKKGDQVRIKTEKDDVWGKPAVVPTSIVRCANRNWCFTKEQKTPSTYPKRRKRKA
jgi:hypothetical protein